MLAVSQLFQCCNVRMLRLTQCILLYVYVVASDACLNRDFHVNVIFFETQQCHNIRGNSNGCLAVLYDKSLSAVIGQSTSLSASFPGWLPRESSPRGPVPSPSPLTADSSMMSSHIDQSPAISLILSDRIEAQAKVTKSSRLSESAV